MLKFLGFVFLLYLIGVAAVFAFLCISDAMSQTEKFRDLENVQNNARAAFKWPKVVFNMIRG